MAATATTIGTTSGGKTAWLAATAAASYLAMRAAGMPAGGINSAGRTNAEQTKLYNDYLAGRGNPAARPGTSKHESGLALDISTSSAAHRWLVANGAKYGWVRTLSYEPWHFEYTGGGGLAGSVTSAASAVAGAVSDVVSDPLGLSDTVAGARTVVLQAVFVLGGVTLITLGAWRMVQPSLTRAIGAVL